MHKNRNQSNDPYIRGYRDGYRQGIRDSKTTTVQESLSDTSLFDDDDDDLMVYHWEYPKKN